MMTTLENSASDGSQQQRNPSALLSLPHAILTALWPMQRKLTGIHVCKTLRLELLKHGGAIKLRGNHPDFDGHTETTALPPSSLFHTLRAFQISIDWRGINDSHIRALLNTLDRTGTHSSITSLSLSGRVGNSGMALLADLYSKATGLRSLDLGDQVRGRAGRRCEWWLDCASSLGEGDPARASISASGIRCLAAGNAPSASLTYLNLYRQNLGSAGAAALSVFLPRWPALSGLHLGSNRIHDAGIAAIMPALSPALTDLRISRNGIEIEGIITLSNALASLSITLLDLSSNWTCLQFTEAAQRLATTLDRGTVRHLILTDTGIRLEGLDILANSWTQRDRLTCLEIGNNNLTSDGVHRLALLIQSCSLAALNLSNNGGSGHGPGRPMARRGQHYTHPPRLE